MPLFQGTLAAVIVLIIMFLIWGGKDDTPVATVTNEPQPLTPTVPVNTGAQVQPITPVPATTVQPQIDKSSFGKDITIQVLQGNDTDKAAYNDVIKTLESYGYTVKKGSKAASKYPKTTLFSVKGQEDKALALQQMDSRFTAIIPKPDSIKSPDMIHVAVGKDWVVPKTDSSEEPSSTSSESANASETSGNNNQSDNNTASNTATNTASNTGSANNTGNNLQAGQTQQKPDRSFAGANITRVIDPRKTQGGNIDTAQPVSNNDIDTAPEVGN